jgi:hypothetical protein
MVFQDLQLPNVECLDAEEKDLDVLVSLIPTRPILTRILVERRQP